MRKRASWMNKATDPVLELLESSGLALPPGAIYYNLAEVMDISRASVTRAIDDLQRYGLVRKPPRAETYYEITDRGVAYLHGDLDANDIEPGEESA
ncbi:MAG: ArsR family transcriptional regulator [Halorientalis sp.]